jgi:hypothetical protein
MKRITMLSIVSGLGLLFAASTCVAQTFTTFDPPTSTSTVPQAINIFGQVTGYYTGDPDPDDSTHGFIRQPDGAITSFDVSVYGKMWNTYAVDINALGQITGNVISYPLVSSGFLRKTDGTIVVFNGSGNVIPSRAAPLQSEPVPCWPYTRCIDGTGPIAINGFGQITGVFGDGSLYSGFLRQPDGTTVNFRAPSTSVPQTVPQAINLLGQIVGHHWGGDFNHGFLRQRSGAIVTFDPPN